jgi:uncharacterized membrane protein YhhN
MSRTGQNWLARLPILYWLTVLVHLIAIALSLSVLQAITKAMLMPLLALVLVKSTKLSVNNNRFLLMGLLFSWAGDVLLLFNYKSEWFFIAGLASFLCAHVLYILYFINIKGRASSLLKQNPLLAVLPLAYGLGLIWLLYPRLGALKLPVLIYACTIITMLLCSLYAFAQLPKSTARLFVMGAAFFVLSDSLLAINKFYAPFPMAGPSIMFTYCVAQFCIAKGGVQRSNGIELPTNANI